MFSKNTDWEPENQYVGQPHSPKIQLLLDYFGQRTKYYKQKCFSPIKKNFWSSAVMYVIYLYIDNKVYLKQKMLRG